MSKMGRKAPRWILFMVATCAIIKNEMIRELYLEYLEKGKTKMQAIGIMMHKILRIIYGMLKNHNPYDPVFTGLVKLAGFRLMIIRPQFQESRTRKGKSRWSPKMIISLRTGSSHLLIKRIIKYLMKFQCDKICYLTFNRVWNLPVIDPYL